jgi:predicted nucleic acid-binding protein
MDPRDEFATPQASIQETARLAARRRLLRGSLGVPAVLTLSSGAALASTSSPIRCFNNAFDDARDSATSVFELRRFVGKEAQSGNDAIVQLVSADEVLALATPDSMIKTPQFTPGTWIEITTFKPIPVKSGSHAPQTDGSKVAPRFAQTSADEARPAFTVTGLVSLGSSAAATLTNSGRIISKSCWTSIV